MATVSLSRRKRILALLSVTQLMLVLDFSIVSVALPLIQQAFHLAGSDLQWVVSAYALLFGGFLLLCGRAADLFNRKWMFQFGLLLFSLGSLAGGLATSPLIVIIARAIQGLGAAIVSPAALALLTTTFPEGAERNWALSIFGSVTGIGFSLGGILGGMLTSLFNWHWVFFVNVPLGLLAFLVAISLLPNSTGNKEREPLDLAGAVLGTGAIASLVLTLSRLATPTSGLIPTLLAGLLAVILVVLFIVVEQRSQHPLVPLSVFRLRNIAGANLVALLTLSIASLLAFVLPLYLHNVLGFTPIVIGLAFLPAGVGGIVGGQLAGWTIKRAGLRKSSVLGPILIALGCLMMTRITAFSGAAWVIVGYMIAGIGFACTMVSATIVATSQMEASFQGLAAGLINTSQQLGGALGASLVSMVTTSVALAVGGNEKIATTTGDQAALSLALVLALLTGVLAALLIRNPTPASTLVSQDAREQELDKIAN